jgi:hypothetical protein
VTRFPQGGKSFFSRKRPISVAESREVPVISGEIMERRGKMCTKSGHLPVDDLHVIKNMVDKRRQF